MTKKYLITVSILGMWVFIMILLGIEVFNGKLTPSKQSLYDMAINVQMFQIATLVGMTFMNRYISRSNLRASYYLFVIGTVLFSGSLYLVATEDVTKLIIGVMGKLTTLGAIILFIGWFVILFTGVTYKHKKRAIQNQ